MTPQGYRVLTPNQCAEGYRRFPPSTFDRRPHYFNGRVAYSRHGFVEVRVLPDGNILVKEPSP